MKHWLSSHRTLLINIFVIGGLLYLIIPRFDEFKHSFAALEHANPLWVLIGTVVYFLGMPLMALQLDAISLKPLRFFTTYKVQMAALFVNRIIPSNMGLLLLNTFYLKKSAHSNTETATVISVSAITSAIAFATIIVLGIVVGSGSAVVKQAHISLPPWALPAGIAVLVIVGMVALLSPSIRKKVQKPVLETLDKLAGYRHRPKDLAVATSGNGLATLTSVFTLFACAQSLGTPISLSLALMTYVLGNALGGLVPTPGGLGGVEAGLYAGLVLGGTSSGAALSIVFLYRVITYWIALIAGIFFFFWLRKDVLANFSFSKHPDTETTAA